mgnify:FL=1
MKYRIEVSEEQLRVIGLAVDEYMRVRMGQFDALAEDLTYDGVPRVKTLTGKYTYDTELQKRCSNIKNLFETAYKMAFPPRGYRGRQHDSWGTCIDLVHAIEHQQWLDAPEGKKEAPGTTYRSHGPVSLGREPYPKIEKVEE